MSTEFGPRDSPLPPPQSRHGLAGAALPTPDDVAWAFNEWMRRYQADPAGFEAQWETVIAFRKAGLIGEVPSYGRDCLAYLEHLIAERARKIELAAHGVSASSLGVHADQMRADFAAHAFSPAYIKPKTL